MFKDKTEALVVGTKIQRIKAHLQENKNTYLAGAGGVAVGTLGMLLLKQNPLQVVNTINNTPVISPVFNNVINNGGHMRKIVRCLETDEMWPSVSKAAEAIGHPISVMSKHINGHKDHIDGLHYAIEGLAAG
jgi:hypothetical protein